MSRRHAALLLALSACAGAACAGGASTGDKVRLGLLRQAVADANWGPALELANDLRRTAPDDIEILTLRGVVLRQHGMLDESVRDLRRAAELDGDVAATQSALAITLEAQGQGAAADAHHRRAVELEPDNPRYLNNLAFSLHARGRLREALASYERAVRIDPSNARIRNNLGFAYAASGRLAAAATQFRHAGPPARLKNNLGVAYEQRGQLAQAQQLFEEALALDQQNDAARRNLDAVLAALRAHGAGALPPTSGLAPGATPRPPTAPDPAAPPVPSAAEEVLVR